MNPAALSLEAMVGLALKGSDWQQMQSETTASTPLNHSLLPVSSEGILDVIEDQTEVPRVLTTKQKQKLKRFDQTIARDAGDILEMIEADTLVPVSQKVTWDEDPELLCSYNWQASTDGTNTIYGEYK